MKLIPLTRGKFAMVDDGDYDLVNKYNWHAYKNGNTNNYYARTWLPYSGNEKRQSLSMHQLVIGKKDGLQIDHIDHNGLNNQRKNLRHCTQAENNRNVTSHKNRTSKYLGVSMSDSKVKNRSYKYWKAQIKSNGKVMGLGSYLTEELAALAYDRAAEKYHGEFANLNFPDRKDIPPRIRKTNITNKSGHTGVCLHPCNKYKKWVAYKWINGRSKFLGSSTTKEGAIILYNEGIKKLKPQAHPSHPFRN